MAGLSTQAGSTAPRRRLSFIVARPLTVGLAGLVAGARLHPLVNGGRLRVGASRQLFVVERADLTLYGAS
jgi:hypothetical protein